MKQYYQFMLRGVATDAQGLQTNANIDEFEEDLHKMLVVRFLIFLVCYRKLVLKYLYVPRVLNNLVCEYMHY